MATVLVVAKMCESHSRAAGLRGVRSEGCEEVPLDVLRKVVVDTDEMKLQ